MALPRGLIIVAVSAVAAGAVLYLRNKVQQQQRGADKRPPSPSPSPSSPSPSPSPSPTPSPKDGNDGRPASGAARELGLFLAGESWYDEVGWQGIWEREAIESAEQWLRGPGKDVLVAERKKLAEHPALLAGCRRRWIVVCRYAGIDVTDAAAVWNQTEA